MATSLRKLTTFVFRRISAFPKHYGYKENNFRKLYFYAVTGGVVGLAITCRMMKTKSQNMIFSPIFAKESHEKVDKRQALQTAREIRFLSFASVEYQGNIYMTPQDFLESVTEEAPRARVGRRKLRDSEVQTLLKKTPGHNRASASLFRNLHQNGLISYTEYLFLLCVLTKPQSGFRIAFNMFDTDGNQRVDKKEFLVLEKILTNQSGNVPRECLPSKTSIGAREKGEACDTTLSRHFFGAKGKDCLKYEDFYSFMDNLQTEVLELEFNEFSHGMPTISEDEFARILLRYTTLTHEENEVFIDRMKSRIPEWKGISFQEFREFGKFLNNLDDFALAVKMYSFLGQPISEEDFKRATKAVTGLTLSDHLVHVVFQLFDSDGDGQLSKKEFISVMKDRLHRGFRSQVLVQGNWETFKSCVKNEMKAN